MMREEHLKCDDGASIGKFVEALKCAKRSDTIDLIESYCSKWGIVIENVKTDVQMAIPSASDTTRPTGASDLDTAAAQTDITQTMNQEGTVSSTEDTEDSSVDECQKLMAKTMISGFKKSGSVVKEEYAGYVGSPSITHSRKRRKTDLGAVNERQLSVEEEDEFCSSGEGTEDQIEPHNAQDARHMKMALDQAKNSQDKKVQVGAVLVHNNTPIGRGYNRMPKGGEGLPWDDNEHHLLLSKYPYVFHAAKASIKDAFMNKADLEGAILYTTLFPANTDAQWIADCGIKELVYLENTYKRKRFTKAAAKIYETCGIKCRRMDPGFEGQH